jgi:hypothetical protein
MKFSYLIPALFTPGIFTPSRRDSDGNVETNKKAEKPAVY